MEGLANLRDAGGQPTTDGEPIATGVLLRSDNLQTLTEADLARFAELGLTDVIDLRSSVEVASEGPGPMHGVENVTIRHHSLFREDEETAALVRGAGATEKALPWVDTAPSISHHNAAASIYISYLADRPDSVVAALREIANAEGAVLVHCAAGKDRTGTIVALALRLADAEPEAVITDYAASSERAQAILDRLMATETYADNLRGRPFESHLSRPETMRAVLEHVEADHGSVAAMLAPYGWTEADTAQLRHKLRPES